MSQVPGLNGHWVSSPIKELNPLICPEITSFDWGGGVFTTNKTNTSNTHKALQIHLPLLHLCVEV